MAEEYDVIVLGGGPGGSSTASFLAKAGKKVILLDRAKFPRDKTCGDGISGRSVGVLTELGVYKDFEKAEHQDMFGVAFSSPNGTFVPISSKSEGNNSAPGFVCRREVFDNVLFQFAKKQVAKCLEGFFASDLIMEGDKVVGVKGKFEGKEMEFRAKILVGADGAGGITARKLGALNDDEGHQCAAIRCYYDNVEGMIDQIELHFIDGVLPGYFWIFPLPNKRANVGIGMLVKDMKKKKVNLNKLMFEAIEKHPAFKGRFKDAKRSSDVKSWILPLASKRVKMYGNGYVLVGDAASLIDPFSGEGIGNALTSGKYASQVILKAFQKNDFSAEALSEYPTLLWDVIGNEVDTNYRMQKMANNKFLLNMMIGKANRSKEIRHAISDALINPHNHKKLIDPFFILRAMLA
ncbi:MAG TPA: geranylgeranyl reductase family protein [Candidatus Bilamarchaeum sp.]|nr:geranylgeranyl reductase family protein [Candidatus Bilamarchaeum sp.]